MNSFFFYLSKFYFYSSFFRYLYFWSKVDENRGKILLSTMQDGQGKRRWGREIKNERWTSFSIAKKNFTAIFGNLWLQRLDEATRSLENFFSLLNAKSKVCRDGWRWKKGKKLRWTKLMKFSYIRVNSTRVRSERCGKRRCGFDRHQGPRVFHQGSQRMRTHRWNRSNYRSKHWLQKWKVGKA